MTRVDLRPSEEFTFSNGKGDVLLIACGALAREIVSLIEKNRWSAFDVACLPDLAREIVSLIEKNRWSAFDVACLPAKWHNTPQLITPAVRQKIREARGSYRKIFVLYGDCGSGGLLDRMLAEEGVERIDGPHCYAFYSGNERFSRTAEDDVTAFYLTDYLARHFDKLIWEGLGLKDHPELLTDYFGNYTKLIYLAQTRDEDLAKRAIAAARKLGLQYEYRYTGYGELETSLNHRAGAGESS